MIDLFQICALAITAVDVALGAPDHHFVQPYGYHDHQQHDRFFLTKPDNSIPVSYDNHASSDYGIQESYGAPDYGTVENSEAPDYGTGETYGSPDYYDTGESYGAPGEETSSIQDTFGTSLEAMGIKLPFLKPFLKPFIKPAVKKPGSVQPGDPGLIPQSYESPDHGTGVKADETGLVPGKSLKAKLLFIVVGILLPLALLVMVLEMTFTVVNAVTLKKAEKFSLLVENQEGRRKREAGLHPISSLLMEPENFESIIKSIR